MNAATLTAARDQTNRGPDGDRPFVLACQLGHHGKAAQLAYAVARREASKDRAGHGHLADARIADRIIELINGCDPATSDDTQKPYQARDEFWQQAWIAAGDDREYRMWLFAAGTAFDDLCGSPPHADDLTDPLWRQQYDAGRHPHAAARHALHVRPMVQLDAGRVACPVCLTPGAVHAEQVATKLSVVLVDGKGLYAEGRGGKPSLMHTRTVCAECGAEVRLPNPIATEDWL